MKKTILSIAVIAAAIFAASCQKEDLRENTATEGSASVFTATIESVAGTKTTVERVDGTPVVYKTKWDNGDEISINGTIFTATPASDATKATFTKNSGDDPTVTYEAYFPKELCKKVKGLIVSLPESYTYADGKYNMPMYAESTTTSLSFKNLCGVLAITVNGTDFTSVSSIEVSSDQQMNGLFTATAEGVLSFVSKTLEDADKKVTLKFDTAKSIESAGSATFYIPVPPATNHTLTIKVTDGSTTKTMVTKKSGGVAVERNMIYPIVFADNSLVPGALPGVFSVSATKKVYFSKGNLTATIDATGAPTAWKFAANQYDYIGEGGANKTIGVTAGDVDLFGWSASNNGGTSTTDNYGIKTSTITSDYSGDFHDWGKAIGDGNTWRTLSKDEWTYLINSKNDETIRKSKYKNGVTVCDKESCLILVPDECLNGYSFDNTKTNYTADEWATAEAAGLVCLPAAGSRDGSGVSNVGFTGSYWSSTAYNIDQGYNVNFNGLNVSPNQKSKLGSGCSVRLITDASVTPAPTPTTTGTAKATIGGSEVDVNWVQLWKDGPKFAEYNVGASSATDVGSTMTFTDATKAGAEYVWGANWCTPSKDQMDELRKAATSDGSTKIDCNYIQENGIYGFKFTGKETGYTSNSVFFPAQDGSSDIGNARYWSATAEGDAAWSMYLHCSDGIRSSIWGSYDQVDEFLVRPVLKN